MGKWASQFMEEGPGRARGGRDKISTKYILLLNYRNPFQGLTSWQ